jgi:hypothetical protein
LVQNEAARLVWLTRAPRRVATFHHATLRVAPHRYATREPLGAPGGSHCLKKKAAPESRHAASISPVVFVFVFVFFVRRHRMRNCPTEFDRPRDRKSQG